MLLSPPDATVALEMLTGSMFEQSVSPVVEIEPAVKFGRTVISIEEVGELVQLVEFKVEFVILRYHVVVVKAAGEYVDAVCPPIALNPELDEVVLDSQI